MNWFKALLILDLRIAQRMGAPDGYTLSGWSYKLELEGKPWGKLWRPLIDTMPWFGKDHCKRAYEFESQGGRELNSA